MGSKEPQKKDGFYDSCKHFEMGKMDLAQSTQNLHKPKKEPQNWFQFDIFRIISFRYKSFLILSLELDFQHSLIGMIHLSNSRKAIGIRRNHNDMVLASAPEEPKLRCRTFAVQIRGSK